MRSQLRPARTGHRARRRWRPGRRRALGAGLDAGGDDYLPKPYAFAELIARVENLGHRAKEAPQATKLKAADLEKKEEREARKVERSGKNGGAKAEKAVAE